MSSASTIAGSRQWLRHFAIYAVGVISLNALSFVLVPIYTRRIPPVEYGVLEILNRCQEVLAVIVMSGFATAAVAFYQHEAKQIERRRLVFSTAMYGIVLNSAILITLTFPFAEAISDALFRSPGYAWAIRAFLFIIPLEVIFQTGLVNLQANFRSSAYVAASVSRLLLGASLSLVLVFWMRLGLRGAVAAALINTAVPALVCLGLVISRARWKAHWGLWKEMLAYGLPFVPGGFFLFVLNSGDRYFLNAFQGPEVVGLYAVSYKVGSIVTFAVLMPFIKIWGSMSIDLALRAEGPAKIARATTYLAVAYCYIGLLVALSTPILLRTLVGSRYWGADRAVPLILLAYLFWAISVVGDTVFYATKQTKVKPLILLVSCILCLSLYALLIPTYSAMGAAWATCIAYAFFATLTLRVGQRYLAVPYEFLRLAKLLTVTLISFGVGRWIVIRGLGSELSTTFLAALLLPLLLTISGFLTVEEKRALLALRLSPLVSIDS